MTIRPYDLDTPLWVYGVDTLEAARALVLSGVMPPGLAPRPDDRETARSALQAYFDDALAGRRRDV